MGAAQGLFRAREYGGYLATLREAAFRCTVPGCASQHRLTLDHRDNDAMNSRRENLQVVCFSHNRAKEKTVITKDLSAMVVRAIFDAIDETGSFPKNTEIAPRMGIKTSQLSGTIYFIHMLRARLDERRRSAE